MRIETRKAIDAANAAIQAFNRDQISANAAREKVEKAGKELFFDWRTISSADRKGLRALGESLREATTTMVTLNKECRREETEKEIAKAIFSTELFTIDIVRNGASAERPKNFGSGRGEEK